jgi:hypothetical protein
VTELTATLFIGITDSRCGHCRQPTLLRDDQGAPITHHTDVSGYDPEPGGGCGARFVDTGRDHTAITSWHLRNVRPDLPVHNHAEETHHA